MEYKFKNGLSFWCNGAVATFEGIFPTRKWENKKPVGDQIKTGEGVPMWDVVVDSYNLGGKITITMPAMAADLPSDVARGDKVTFGRLKVSVRIGTDGVPRYNVWGWDISRYTGEETERTSLADMASKGMSGTSKADKAA